MNAVVRKAGLADIMLCDSAGTMDWHTGKLPDARMRQAAKEHGYDFKGAARQVLTTDLEEFDLVLAMDRSNLADLRLLDTEEAYDEKIRLFGRYCSGNKFPEEVPDPYYGGEEGFHMVIQMVENGCEGIEGVGRHGQWHWVKNKKGWKKPATFYEYIFEENK